MSGKSSCTDCFFAKGSRKVRSGSIDCSVSIWKSPIGKSMSSMKGKPIVIDESMYIGSGVIVISNGSGVISNSKSGVLRRLGVDDQLEFQADAASNSGRGKAIGSGLTLNLLNSLPSGEGRCFEPLIKGVPSGFLFRVRPGLPCFLDTP